MKTFLNKNTNLFGKIKIYKVNKDLWACLDNPTLKQLYCFISCVNEKRKDYKSLIKGIKKNEFAELYVHIPLDINGVVKVTNMVG